jgi:hypothetical protein
MWPDRRDPCPKSITWRFLPLPHDSWTTCQQSQLSWIRRHLALSTKRRILRHPKVKYQAWKWPPKLSILSQFSPVISISATLYCIVVTLHCKPNNVTGFPSPSSSWPAVCNAEVKLVCWQQTGSTLHIVGMNTTQRHVTTQVLSPRVKLFCCASQILTTLYKTAFLQT